MKNKRTISSTKPGPRNTSKTSGRKEEKKKVLTAKSLIARLKTMQSDSELEKIQRYFKSEEGEYAAGDKFIGVQMGKIFALAKEYRDMPLVEVEELLESFIHEVRVGGVSIMDFQARDKKTSEQRRKELFDLYLRRHDRINNWDLVDRSAIYVIGGYLADKPRDILYKLARSRNMWERRTAIVSTAFFLKSRDTEDTFRIAELLVHDKEDLIHKAAGGWIREAGKKDPHMLEAFLDKYGATMPRTMLRYAIEKLPQKKKERYMGLKKKLK